MYQYISMILFQFEEDENEDDIPLEKRKKFFTKERMYDIRHL